MKTSVKFLLMTVALGVLPAQAQRDCVRTVENVRVQVSRDRSEVLNVVAAVQRDPDCACEIVKTAITTSRANRQTVAAIVSAAGNAAPDRLDLIVQCATAAAPDAVANIRSAAAGVQASSGLAGGAGQTAGEFNPLDFPGDAPGVAVQGGAESSGAGAGDGTGGVAGRGPGSSFQPPPYGLPQGVQPPVVTDPNP
jgi:hypothetical protein